MTENQIRLLICLVCAGLWLLELLVFEVRIRQMKKKLTQAGKEVSAAESRLLMIMIISVIVIALPFLIRFESFFVTAVIQACGVMASYIGLQERVGALKAALEKE